MFKAFSSCLAKANNKKNNLHFFQNCAIPQQPLIAKPTWWIDWDATRNPLGFSFKKLEGYAFDNVYLLPFYSLEKTIVPEIILIKPKVLRNI